MKHGRVRQKLGWEGSQRDIKMKRENPKSYTDWSGNQGRGRGGGGGCRRLRPFGGKTGAEGKFTGLRKGSQENWERGGQGGAWF